MAHMKTINPHSLIIFLSRPAYTCFWAALSVELQMLKFFLIQLPETDQHINCYDHAL